MPEGKQTSKELNESKESNKCQRVFVCVLLFFNCFCFMFSVLHGSDVGSHHLVLVMLRRFD